MDFGDVNLPDKLSAHIRREIRRATMQARARLNVYREREVAFYIPEDWCGLAARMDKGTLR